VEQLQIKGRTVIISSLRALGDFFMDKKVEIYTTPTCHYCHMAKDFFKANGVAYEEHDVMTDLAARQAMVDKSGQMGVPVIVVGDELIVGFDEAHLRSMLGL